MAYKPRGLTVGDVRRAVEGLPDDAPVYPEWAGKPPPGGEHGLRPTGVRGVKEAEGSSEMSYLLLQICLSKPEGRLDGK